MPQFVINDRVQRLGWPQVQLSGEPWRFHERLPGYTRTPLRALPTLAETLGIASLWVKDEARRLELPAFKVLGASWAVYRLLQRELNAAGLEIEPWQHVAELRERIAPLTPRPLVTATDGNHGRGVARIANWIGWPALVFMPRNAAPSRIEAIRSEGAEVHLIEGNHDDAVKVASETAVHVNGWLLQDTSWPEYEEIPGWIVEGYATLMHEVEQQLKEMGEGQPTLVFAPFGTGALAGAIIRHFRQPGENNPALLTVEPTPACCALESLRERKSVTVALPEETVMVGLNCNSVASILLDPLLRGVDAAIAIEDCWAMEALESFRDQGITSGESGASSLAGLLALMRAEPLKPLREHLGLDQNTRVLLLNTEGARNSVIG